MNPERKKMMDGVYLTYLYASKFKTDYVSAQLLIPLTREKAGWNALLPNVLRRGTICYPDIEILSKALDLLYGAELEGTVRKKGDNQCIGFAGSFLAEQYLPEKTPLLEPVTSLLGELLCSPVTENGRFATDYVEGEKQNLIDLIRSSLNDKREYAGRRLMQEMCREEPYGLSRLGDEASVQRITAGKLYLYYQELLASAPLELFYCGSAPLERVERAFTEAFSALPRQRLQPPAITGAHAAPEQPRYVEEQMDVTQGKLAVGFCSDSQDWAALMLANVLFGGSSSSKLFMNVREKLSLCYYASSVYHRSKGLVTVSSGIECRNYRRVLDEIQAQLQQLREGCWESWEEESARSALHSSISSMQDSAARMEDFYLGQNVLDLKETPEELQRQLQRVNRERIMQAAASLRLDTVYFLKGEAVDE